MKQKAKNAVKFILFVCLAVLSLYGAMLVTERKNAHAKFHDFFANTDKIDILLFGNSHVINSLNPLRLYELTGYSSYNMGCHGAPMTATYWTLMNALDYCTPKLVVVDTNILYLNHRYIDQPDEKTAVNFTTGVKQLHLNLDAFPYSETKRNAIRDLIADEKIREQFYFPATTYHNRWQELTWNDFLRLADRDEHNRLMGAEMNYGFARNLNLIAYPEDLSDDRETVCSDYLRRFLDECKARNITAVVTYLPYAGMREDYEDAMIAKRIAAEYGFPFLNFMDRDVRTASGIDLRTDMMDSGHLNVIGAEKATAHLGRFLQSLDLPELTDHRGDAAYDSLWMNRLAEYVTNEETVFDEIGDPFFRVAFTHHQNMRYILFLQENSLLLRDPDFLHLVVKISGSSRIMEASERNESYLLICNGNTMPLEAVGGESFENKITFMGKTSLVSSGPYHNLFVNDQYDNNMLDMDAFIYSELQMITFDPEITYRYYTAHASGFDLNRRN